MTKNSVILIFVCLFMGYQNIRREETGPSQDLQTKYEVFGIDYVNTPCLLNFKTT